MSLRDHFRAPLDNFKSWEGFHGQWPAMIVLALTRLLPSRYTAEPRVRLGCLMTYEVLIHDTEHGRRLVAAIEIVSPANKDREDHRRAFVSKCVTLLLQQVSVIIIDLVTTRKSNLYAQLLDTIDRTDPALVPEPSPLYSVACRVNKPGQDWQLDCWFQPLEIGKPLPTLPLWLSDSLAIPLELQSCYEDTCRVLRIP